MKILRAGGVFLAVWGLGFYLPAVWAAAPLYEKGLQCEAAENWEAAYDAYVASVENGEQVDVDEKKRPIDRAILVATEHLGRFDEALALMNRYLEGRKDGYVHRLMGYFYKEKLHDFDRAREQFRLSYEDFLAVEGRLFAALYSLEQEAGCYRTELYEMEYYANRKHREAYTRKAHNILLEGFARVEGVRAEGEFDYNKIRKIYLGSLGYVYGLSWYSGRNPELAKEYEQGVQEYRDREWNPHRDFFAEMDRQTAEGNWPEAARMWEGYRAENPAVSNDLSILEHLVYCYYVAKDWENTLQTACLAMDEMEKQLNAMKTDIEKTVAVEGGWLATYDRAVAAAEALKRDGMVFDIMERSRARAMLDLLGGRDYTKRQERLSADEREILLLKSRLDEIQVAIENERKIGRPEEMASLQRSLVLVEDASAKIQRRADIARREILSATRVEPLTVQEAQALIGDDTLISIWTGIHISVVTKDKVTSRYIRGSSYFDKLIRDFRKAIENRGRAARALTLEADGAAPPDATAEADAQILAIGRKLYDLVIKPVEKDFSRKSDRVYIVYDRMHPLIPYELLHDGERYLAEKYTLVYAPSASVLQHCMERRRPLGGKLLALGNPDLGNPDYALAYAEDEVQKLAETYPDSRILTGVEASEAAVQLLSSDADILHFACHGVIDEDEPRKNHLRLAPDKENDGYLTADEIMDLHLQSSLVTLSACDTGRGRILMGGEILGLTRAWMYAGAPSVLASLWKVDDRATSRLMTAFYENLKTHDKAKALQLAQLGMIKEGLSPYYWAAFCLYGDYQ